LFRKKSQKLDELNYKRKIDSPKQKCLFCVFPGFLQTQIEKVYGLGGEDSQTMKK
jgi:hypothetical protein